MPTKLTTTRWKSDARSACWSWSRTTQKSERSGGEQAERNEFAKPATRDANGDGSQAHGGEGL